MKHSRLCLYALANRYPEVNIIEIAPLMHQTDRPPCAKERMLATYEQKRRHLLFLPVELVGLRNNRAWASTRCMQ